MTSSIWTSIFGTGISQEDLKGPASLSEDACNDLVHSLVRLGYLSDIATSLDGKTFITQEQLTQDITSVLNKRNGRVSLLDLPRALNVNSDDIQARIMDLMKANPGRYVQAQDELFKMEYLDDMISQLNDELTKRGFWTVADQCRKHKLSLEFMKQFLRDKVGTVINGHWDTADRGAVYASWFMETERNALSAMLQELKEPTPLHVLQARHVVQDQFFYALCDALSKDQDLPGVFKGVNDQGLFVPRPYKEQQAEMIESFFRNNGFIEYGIIKRHGVTDPKAYIQTNHPSALLLDTHAVKESIWSIVDASVEDCVSNLSWIDIKPLVPTPLTKEDISSLLRQLPSLKEPSRIAISPEQDHSLTGLGGGVPQEITIVQDSIVVTSGQLQRCLLEMGPLLDRKAKSLVSWRLSFGGDARIEGIEDLEDMNVLGLLGGKEASPALARVNSKLGAAVSKQQKKRFQDFLTIQDVKEEVRNLEPDFEPALVNAVAGTLYKDLLLNLRDRNRSVVLNQVEDEDEASGAETDVDNKEPAQEDKIGLIQLAAKDLSDRIRLASKGIDLFDDVTVRNSLSKYLLQTWCTEMLDMLVLSCSLVENTNASPSSDSSTQVRDRVRKSFYSRGQGSTASEAKQGPFVVTAEDQQQLLTFVAADVATGLQKLRKIVGGSCKHKSLVEFQTISQPFVENLPETAAAPRDESQLLTDHLAELSQNLSGIKPQAGDALMLHIVTLIVFQSWTGNMLHASGKFVPRILRQLRAIAEKFASSGADTRLEQLELLDKMLAAVLAAAKQESDSLEGTFPCQDVYNLGIELSAPHA
ncbi:E3 UFM1-protein ligase 1 [Podila minutissima]|uniref:E3 UFM1-protein ligase 1 n=1 Tax=Podila minutissima TaxID=64525 RepID=A0A9P5SNR4_9FUNG|nr:E3 UFM1-protein ligase 1 [Podila minutissima]